MTKFIVTVDPNGQLHHPLVSDHSKLKQSVRPLKSVLENSPRHTEHIWRVILWICGLSAGAVSLFIETMTVTVPSLVAVVGLLTLTAFVDHFTRKNEAEPVLAFVTPISVLRRIRIISFDSQSSTFCNASRMNFDCFTNEETASWLKDEPNFNKRIVTPIDLIDFKHRRYPSSFHSFVSKTRVVVRDCLREFLSDLSV